MPGSALRGFSRVCHHISSFLFSSLPTGGILECCLAPPTKEDMIGVGKATTFRWDSPPRRSLYAMVLTATYALHAKWSRHSSLRLLGWAMRRPQSRVKVKTEGQTRHMNYAMVGIWSACLCVQKCAHCGRTRLSIGSPLSETCGYLSARLHFTLCQLSSILNE